MGNLDTHKKAPDPSKWWKRALVLLLFCTITFVIYPFLARLELGEWTFPFDDPWIHQVYARNIAQHGQYAFNLGEASTGSSAPLWTLLMVPPHLFSLSPIFWAFALGLLSLGCLGVVTWEWASQRFPRPLPFLLTMATLLSPQMGWTGVEGMETALVAAMGLLILKRLDGAGWKRYRSPFLDGLLNGLFLWLRPEGPLLTLVVLWHRRRESWRRLLAFVGGFLALAVPYCGFHCALSGRPLPQTVYAKMAYYSQPLSLSTVVGFLRTLLLTFAPGPWLLIILLLPLSLYRMGQRKAWPWGPGLAWAGITVLAAALRLPIVLHFGRHFAPILPPLILGSGEAILGLSQIVRRGILVLGACLLLIGLVIGASFYVPACRGILSSQVAMGRWISDYLPRGTLVATHDVGAIGYFGERPVIDTLALITPELTTVVAADDRTVLLKFLGQHDVHYLATLEGIYPEIQQMVDVKCVVKHGRMVLLHLPDSPI